MAYYQEYYLIGFFIYPVLIVGIPIYNINYRIKKSLRSYEKARIERYYFFWIAMNSLITVVGLSLIFYLFTAPEKLDSNGAMVSNETFLGALKFLSMFFIFIGLSALLNRWIVWNSFKAFRQNNNIDSQPR